MKPVKLCYRIKYCLKKISGIEISDTFFESLLTGYYNFFKSRKNGISSGNRRNRKLTVSLTSIPSRTGKLWITIESLLRQNYKPDRIILWLAEDEFRGIELPEKIREQQKRGLQICYCDNLRSYKKFYDTVQKYPDDYVVTVDDDIIYAEDMIKTLVKTYRKNPGCIVCNRSHVIKKARTGLSPYDCWMKYENRGKRELNSSFYNFFTGCGGTLFPMFRMDRRVADKEDFMRLAPYADDVWLNFCAWISGIQIVNTKGILGHVIEIRSSSDNGLTRTNVMHRKNDEQIKRVINYLDIDIDQYLQ